MQPQSWNVLFAKALTHASGLAVCWLVLTGAHSFTRMNRAAAAAASWMMVALSSGFIDAVAYFPFREP